MIDLRLALVVVGTAIAMGLLGVASQADDRSTASSQARLDACHVWLAADHDAARTAGFSVTEAIEDSHPASREDLVADLYLDPVLDGLHAGEAALRTAATTPGLSEPDAKTLRTAAESYDWLATVTEPGQEGEHAQGEAPTGPDIAAAGTAYTRASTRLDDLCPDA